MKRILPIAVLALLPAGPVVADEPADAGVSPGGITSERFRETVDRILPAMVKVYGAGGFAGMEAYGCGILVDPDGWILTYAGTYLSTDDGRVTVILDDGRNFAAEVRRRDPDRSAALLKIDAEGETFPHVPIAEAPARAGDWVFAVGNPFNIAAGEESLSVSLGTVMSVQSIDLRTGLRDFDIPGPMILMDIINNPGTKGAGLFDLQGRLVGMNIRMVESKTTNTLVNVSLPIGSLEPFVSDTLANPEVRTAYRDPPPPEPLEPGIHGIRLLEEGIGRSPPPYVDRVVAGTPAAEAGIRADDLIVQVNGRTIHSGREFRKGMDALPASATVSLRVLRDDALRTFTFDLVSLEDLE